MINKICIKCGKKFTVNNARKDTALFCSHKCRQNRVTKICEACGSAFEIKASHARVTFYCNAYCRKVGLRRRRQTEIEEQFGEPITQLLNRLYYDENLGIKQIAKRIGVSDHVLWNWFEALGIERRNRSDAVALQWVDNDERKEQTAQIIGDRAREYYANGGISPSKFPEVRKKISEAKMGDKNWMFGRFGPQNHAWKGGKITYRGNGWDSVRIQVKRRDNNKCRRCGTKKDLTVHHIIPYRETQDNSFDNLVTLCRHCHVEVEHHGATWD